MMGDPSPKNTLYRRRGPGGLTLLCLEHMSGYRVTVSEYGAQVLSWTNPKNEELLFLSNAATFAIGKAIRGGIPVVFPQFGKGALPSHGFARTSMWEIFREEARESGPVSVGMRLRPNGETSKIWPHQFVAELELELSETLSLELRVSNHGAEPFSFRAALHTYFGVDDVERCSIEGLSGVSYVDFLRDRNVAVEESEAVRLGGPTDRAYRGSPGIISLQDWGRARSFQIQKQGFHDTVVWNPWSEGNATLADLAPGSWRSMVCVESGSVLDDIRISPGETHVSTQILSVATIG